MSKGHNMFNQKLISLKKLFKQKTKNNEIYIKKQRFHNLVDKYNI